MSSLAAYVAGLRLEAPAVDQVENPFKTGALPLFYDPRNAHEFLHTALDIIESKQVAILKELNQELNDQGPFYVTTIFDAFAKPPRFTEADISFGPKLMRKIQGVTSEGQNCELKMKIANGIERFWKAEIKEMLATKMIVKELKQDLPLPALSGHLYKVVFLDYDLIIAKKRAVIDKLSTKKIFPPSPPVGRDSDSQDLEWISDLNQIQKKVVKVALNLQPQPFPTPFLVRGPPGTGKTTTLVELILQIVAKETRPQIIVCAPSNRAADNIIERIPESQHLKVLRFVASAKMNRRGNGFKLPGIDYRSSFEEFPIVVCTVGMLHSFYFFKKEKGFTVSPFTPTHIIVDEASQVPDTDMILVLGLFKEKVNTKFIMFGDDRQLGPVITEENLRESPLSVSMFERLLTIKKFEESSVCLLENYRSVPGVVAPFNKLFYKNTLIAMVNPTNYPEMFSLKLIIHRALKPGDSSTDPSGVYFHRVVGTCLSGESKSCLNTMEAEVVKMLFGKLTNIGIQPRDIGIITPYIDQVRLLQGMIKSNAVTIGSVDSFQGQERSVIIVSTVRSFGSWGIGFVADQKRLNVTISRAKTCLIIVGNDSFLSKNCKVFRDLIGFPEINFLKW